MGAGPAALVAQTPPAGQDQWRANAHLWGKRYAQSPGDKTASITRARLARLVALRRGGAVMRTAAVEWPQDMEVLGEYGKALADDSQLAQAKDVLTRAYTDDRPDWTIMSVQGVVEDQLGDHDGARRFYDRRAQDRAGRSLRAQQPRPLLRADQAVAAGRDDAARGERRRERRRAGAQHLALVLSLEGKYAQAEEISRQDMSADAAHANVQAIRQMIARRGLASLDRSAPPTDVATQ